MADPDYKTLKDDIKKLEKTVQDARSERADADKKLTENRQAQKKPGADLAALKKEATTLARTAGEKADALNDAQQKLASKQGELRGTAASHAVAQLSAAGSIDDRVGEATNALDDWRGALGSLPEVPQLRSLDGNEDPEVQASIRKQDKKALESFVGWTDGEESRIDTEIKQVKQIIDAKPKLVGSEDGGASLVSDAESLKKTLEDRKKRVVELRKTAQDRIKGIK
ncbi:MAG: hypothetical protein K8I27_16010 [Planctomycetes bacterium]|nr:hypothetical protein [Planctomycetota bacterium]